MKSKTGIISPNAGEKFFKNPAPNNATNHSKNPPGEKSHQWRPGDSGYTDPQKTGKGDDMSEWPTNIAGEMPNNQVPT